MSVLAGLSGGVKLGLILAILLSVIGFIYWIYRKIFNAGYEKAKQKEWEKAKEFYDSKIERLHKELNALGVNPNALWVLRNKGNKTD